MAPPMPLEEIPAIQREIVARNRENHDAYREGLAEVPGLRVLDYAGQAENNFLFC